MKHEAGFTILELTVVIAIFLIVAVISIPSIVSLQKTPDLSTAAEEVIGGLRLAQNKTLAFEYSGQYGVYFDTASSPQQFIIFQGSSYATRVSAYDQVRPIPTTVEFSSVNVGASNQVVFDKLTGSTTNSGSVTLRLKSDPSQTLTVYVDSTGIVGYTALSTPTDTHTKDSRHVHFDYNRTIAIDANNNLNEALTCTFYKSDNTTVPVVIAAATSPLIGGQLDITCAATVDGVSQSVSIKTHHLNDGSYANKNQFSIHRDGRYNTKKVIITLSGDPGFLIQYSADGLTTNSSSTYISPAVSNSNWQ